MLYFLYHNSHTDLAPTLTGLIPIRYRPYTAHTDPLLTRYWPYTDPIPTLYPPYTDRIGTLTGPIRTLYESLPTWLRILPFFFWDSREFQVGVFAFRANIFLFRTKTRSFFYLEPKHEGFFGRPGSLTRENWVSGAFFYLEPKHEGFFI